MARRMAYKRNRKPYGAVSGVQEGNPYPCQADLLIAPVSLNRYTRWRPIRQWDFKRQLMAFLEVAFRPETKNALVADKAKKRVTVTIMSSRTWDADNLTGTVKPLLDALKVGKPKKNGKGGGMGFIVDDSPQWCETVVLNEKVPRHRACIRLRIERAE